MRIVNGTEFLAINEPIVYQEYYSEFDWGLPKIKLGNCGKDDFFDNPLFGQDILTMDFEPTDTGGMLELITRLEKSRERFVRNYETVERDGSYVKETDRFVIYDNDDIKELIITLIEKVMLKGESHDE